MLKYRTVCIIQARMGSSRLPGKSLMKIKDSKPLIHFIYDRVCLAKEVDYVTLATTDQSSDDELFQYCKNNDINIDRGSELDLIKRYFDIANLHHARIIVRIPADNPLIIPSEIDRCIKYFINKQVDYASNLGPYLDNQYPDGLGAEVLSFDLLKYLHNTVIAKYHREHVTSFLRDERHSFSCGSPPCPTHFSRPDVVLDINTLDDYNFMKKLIISLDGDAEILDPESIIKHYDRIFERSGYARK